jgi:hypothetical protein
MVIRTSNQPTASPRVAAIRRGVGSILLLLAGCADLDDPDEPRAAVEDDLSETVVADADADAQECRGLKSAPRLEITAPIAHGRDLVLAADDSALRVQVRNLGDEAVAIEPRLTWRSAGGVARDNDPRFELAPGEIRELVIDLPRDLDAQPASLDVRLRTWHGRKRGGDESLPTTFFHVDAGSGRLHVYDHDGLLARHRAGDLSGTHRAVGARDDLAGVGVARPARPEDLVGDPTDARNTRGAPR